MAGSWRALRRARGWAALAGLRARPDKFGGVSVDLGELRGSPRLERAAFGRWLRGKCRAGVPSHGAGGRGAVCERWRASRQGAPSTTAFSSQTSSRGREVEGAGRREQRSFPEP